MRPIAPGYLLAQCEIGFTLIELMVVIGIIAALAGISFPTYVYVQRQGNIKGTRALVHGVVGAITNYRLDTQLVDVAGRQELRRLWDLNGDELLDEDPLAAGATTSLKAIAPNGYRGFAYLSGISVRANSINANGAIIDPWKRQLHIHHGRAQAGKIVLGQYGSQSFGISSAGPDGVSTPDDVTSDDICNWR